MRICLLTIFAAVFSIHCKAVSLAPKPDLQGDMMLRERYKAYESAKIEFSRGLFKQPFIVAGKDFNARGVEPLFDQQFVNADSKSKFKAGLQYQAFGSGFGLAGATLGIYGVAADSSDSGGSQNQLGFYLGAFGASLVGMILQGVGSGMVGDAVDSYNNSLKLKAVPELAFNRNSIEIRNYAYLEHRLQ